MNPIELLTTAEAADHLRISPQTLNIWRCKGTGPAFCKIGRTVRYTTEALQEYLIQNTCRHTGG
ncbi:helix-turn-helix domain-containing protein [Pseudovibrio sp. POLY-S9]|uniref:helix-turn-helix domain-containing protein n=1 Tax=Pseudovibrio sp. POLY-S9 TaxID=1576596 RepID=UPI0009E920BB|nr:helix-turn-helix domain-containing protein [Pseudovibrio sp. POLY-S9]